ncbi:uroporphyrinogen-III synthase [Salipiger marinus]|uniref:uroporphyrinogen-III synthase n=1 Tax=Salipiger marinus TaxID=555512 RepID=UPI0040582410
MPPLPPFLLLTRPERESRRFLAELAAERAEPLVSPLLDIVTTGPLPDLAGVRGLIFTSANGVRAYAALAGPPLSPCFVVGEATARAARDVGLVPVVAQGDAESLLALILDHAPEGPLLHLRGTFARGGLAERLTAAGLPVREAVVYDQPARPLTPEARAALQGDRPVVVPLFSPRTARLFAAEAPCRAPLFVAAMSAEVAVALQGLYLREQEILARPESGLMREAVGKLLKSAGTLVVPPASVEGCPGKSGPQSGPDHRF